MAFAICTSLTSITLPPSVTSIEEGAFAICTSLISITLPSSVISIGEKAFGDCTSLMSVTLSRKTHFGKYVFPKTTRIVYSD